MAVTLSGWLGYGGAVQLGQLLEPADPIYTRRPFILGDLDSGRVSEVGGGTIGPAAASWGSIGFAGVFDAQIAGNLLLWWPLRIPVPVSAGMTLSTRSGSLDLYFPDLTPVRPTQTWPAGVLVAQFKDGRLVMSGTALQYAGGVLAAQAPVFGAMVTMAQLPSAQPTTGSGQLWNNGGVISVA